MSDLFDLYTQRKTDYETQLRQRKQRQRYLAYARGASFLGAIAAAFFISPYGGYVLAASEIVILSVFGFFLRRSQKVAAEIDVLEQLVVINANELQAIGGDISCFDGGSQYINFDHPYTYDLDVFGDGSIFQSINRCCTGLGSNRLAQMLANYNPDKTDIENRQEAIHELSKKTDYRQRFAANGKLVVENKAFTIAGVNRKQRKSDEDNRDELVKWLQSESFFANSKLIAILLRVVPAMVVAALLLTIFDVLSVDTFVVVGTVPLLITAYYLKRVNELHSTVARKAKILKKYAVLLEIIEGEGFEAPLNKALQQKLVTNDKSASWHLHSFVKSINALDNRLNFIFAILSNLFLLWDLNCVVRIQQWKQRFSTDLPRWFEVIAEFDALLGLATFEFNHPSFVRPVVSEATHTLRFTDGGHPLLPDSVRINNDFELCRPGHFAIVTGANMAGKSTFLRTVGVNLILAMTGSVVCARTFEFSIVQIHTSIRSNDSLQKSESYFYAELKRLHAIIERLNSGENLFVVVDEMLRGTNSKDKHHGSEALLEQLVHKNAIGMVATHDIQLGDLVRKYPLLISNKRFEVTIENNKLQFDYKLQDGISQNLNATFLMKQMGIIVDKAHCAI